jgi:hypothetical protein
MFAAQGTGRAGNADIGKGMEPVLEASAFIVFAAWGRKPDSWIIMQTYFPSPMLIILVVQDTMQ